MAQNVRVTVVTFGSAVDALGFDSREEFVSPGTTVSAIMERLETAFPRLAEARGRIRIAVNLEYADGSRILADGDEIALIPPVSGGSGGPAASSARLTRDRIDVESLLREVSNSANGAIDIFLGVVRAEAGPAGRVLQALDYSAYEPMALAEMERIVADVTRGHPISTAIVVHRLGILAIGDASIAVVVSSPHRAEAFAACRMLIERVKASVPVFKREIWDDQSHRWVNPV